MAKDKPATPSDEVRLVASIQRGERARLKYFCSRIGRDMEEVVVEWVMERLAQEERKLDKGR